MAVLNKYNAKSVLKILAHNTRDLTQPKKNKGIDSSRTLRNYTLHPPEHGVTALENKKYYNRRLSEVYHYHREDVKTACQWFIIAPQDLSQKDEKAFFQATYNYLNSLYGEKNCIQAIVHYDECMKNKKNTIISKPHLHYTFIPVVENQKYMTPNKKNNITELARFKEKVCPNDLITKQHLSNFHRDYQRWIDNCHIECTVHSSNTRGQNNNMDELNLKTKEKELDKARKRIAELENKLQIMR